MTIEEIQSEIDRLKLLKQQLEIERDLFLIKQQQDLLNVMYRVGMNTFGPPQLFV